MKAQKGACAGIEKICLCNSVNDLLTAAGYFNPVQTADPFTSGITFVPISPIDL